MGAVIFDLHARSDDAAKVEGWAAIGRSVRGARASLGWTQAQLAGRCGVHQSTISRMETGRLTGLRWSRFGVVIAALGDAWPPAGPPRPPMLIGWDRLR